MEVTTDAERRWVEAEALLNSAPDQSADQAIRRRRRKTLLIGFGAWLVLVVLGGVIGWFAAERKPPAPDVADASHPLLWVQILGLTCSAVGFLIIVFSVVRVFRSGQWAGRWRAPTSVLTRSQKRELYRQVSGKAPVQPDHLALARDSARRIVQLRRQLWTLAGSWITLFGVALNNSGRFGSGLAAAAIVLLGIAFLLIRRDIRRAARFLEQHPASGGAAGSAADLDGGAQR